MYRTNIYGTEKKRFSTGRDWDTTGFLRDGILRDAKSTVLHGLRFCGRRWLASTTSLVGAPSLAVVPAPLMTSCPSLVKIGAVACAREQQKNVAPMFHIVWTACHTGGCIRDFFITTFFSLKTNFRKNVFFSRFPFARGVPQGSWYLIVTMVLLAILK